MWKKFSSFYLLKLTFLLYHLYLFLMRNTTMFKADVLSDYKSFLRIKIFLIYISAFSTKDKLRSHKRSHSDFREFLCSVCGTAVKNKEYLAKWVAFTLSIMILFNLFFKLILLWLSDGLSGKVCQIVLNHLLFPLIFYIDIRKLISTFAIIMRDKI
jgi:hypothetical protein